MATTGHGGPVLGLSGLQRCRKYRHVSDLVVDAVSSLSAPKRQKSCSNRRIRS